MAFEDTLQYYYNQLNEEESIYGKPKDPTGGPTGTAEANPGNTASTGIHTVQAPTNQQQTPTVEPVPQDLAPEDIKTSETINNFLNIVGSEDETPNASALLKQWVSSFPEVAKKLSSTLKGFMGTGKLPGAAAAVPPGQLAITDV